MFQEFRQNAQPKVDLVHADKSKENFIPISSRRKSLGKKNMEINAKNFTSKNTFSSLQTISRNLNNEVNKQNPTKDPSIQHAKKNSEEDVEGIIKQVTSNDSNKEAKGLMNMHNSNQNNMPFVDLEVVATNIVMDDIVDLDAKIEEME
jgi:hypothetical protein